MGGDSLPVGKEAGGNEQNLKVRLQHVSEKWGKIAVVQVEKTNKELETKKQHRNNKRYSKSVRLKVNESII
jgi:hypothetical protein